MMGQWLRTKKAAILQHWVYQMMRQWLCRRPGCQRYGARMPRLKRQAAAPIELPDQACHRGTAGASSSHQQGDPCHPPASLRPLCHACTSEVSMVACPACQSFHGGCLSQSHTEGINRARCMGLAWRNVPMAWAFTGAYTSLPDATCLLTDDWPHRTFQQCAV